MSCRCTAMVSLAVLRSWLAAANSSRYDPRAGSLSARACRAGPDPRPPSSETADEYCEAPAGAGPLPPPPPRMGTKEELELCRRTGRPFCSVPPPPPTLPPKPPPPAAVPVAEVTEEPDEARRELGAGAQPVLVTASVSVRAGMQTSIGEMVFVRLPPSLCCAGSGAVRYAPEAELPPPVESGSAERSRKLERRLEARTSWDLALSLFDKITLLPVQIADAVSGELLCVLLCWPDDSGLMAIQPEAALGFFNGSSPKLISEVECEFDRNDDMVSARGVSP